MITNKEEDAVASHDITALDTATGDYHNTVFIIPLGAPLPLELEPFSPEAGSLLARLAPLGELEPEGDVAIVPISGTELLTLDRAWNLIQTAKRVAVLTELPGAKYDVIFDQARRSIGLRLIDWPSIAEAFAHRQVVQQRTGDTDPWRANEIETVRAKSKPRGDNLQHADRGLPEFEDDDEGANDPGGIQAL